VSTGRQRVNIAYTGYARTSESYIAWVNTRGRPVYQQGNLHYASEPDQIVTYRPGLLPQVATLDVGTELTYLALQPWMLERHLEKLLEHQISGPSSWRRWRECAPARDRAGGACCGRSTS
jgi:hypothetical protein